MTYRIEKDAVTSGELPFHRLPIVENAQGFTLLSGIKVLDLTSSVAGPYATMLLSDFGAEIVKVEKPGGDDARSWGPPFLDGQSLWFTSVNRNKKSVALDVTNADDRRLLDTLIADADVVVTNQPPLVQKKLRLDYASISTVKPDVVFVSITGFGLTGTRANLTCYDLIAEGYSGIMDITGAADSEPQKIGAPAADMLAGQDAAMAAIAALYERRESGKGRLIDVSLVESMVRFLACRASAYLGSGEVPVRSGGTDSVIAIYQPFQTADLPITLGIGSDGIWRRFWQEVGQPEVGELARYATNQLRRQHRSEIVERIQSIMLGEGRASWLQRFARARVPAGPIYRMDEVTLDEALIERGLFFALSGEDGTLIPQIGLGIQIDGEPARPRFAPPKFGQHSETLLKPLRP